MDIRKKQRAVVDALEDIKARDIVVLDTARLPSIFERVIIASGESNRQIRALADSVVKKMKSIGAHVGGIEGGHDSDWVLVDLGEIIVHVMHPTVRAHYNLEEIWGGKPVRVKTIEATVAAAKKPAAPRKRVAKKSAAA
jgi:ribosome-associated protein